MFREITQDARRYYEAELGRFGDGARGVNWRDTASQYLRFEQLATIGDLGGCRVHDLGCGLAHFYDYLSQQAIECDYVGTDISPKMIATARARVGDGASLHVADVLTDQEETWMRADYVVNSGVFTVKGDTDAEGWWGFVEAMIRRMFDLCDIGIGFNLMTSYVDYRDAHLFYKSPESVFEFCVSELSPRVAIRHDYPLYEYMTFVYR